MSILDIKVPKIFLPIFSCIKRYIVLKGSRGSAKSTSVAIKLLLDGIKNTERILCTREFQTSISDSSKKILEDIINEYNLHYHYEIQDKRIIGKNGTEFIFAGLSRNINNIRSKQGITRVWIEEAHTISAHSFKVLIPTIREEGSQIFITYNPEFDDDFIHVEFSKERDDTLLIEANWDDNPFFPAVLEEERKNCLKYNPEDYDHIWNGKTIQHTQAQIFYGKWSVQDFSEEEHIEESNNNLSYCYGADWGTKDPTVITRCYVYNDYLYITHAEFKENLEIDDIPKLFDKIPDIKLHQIQCDNTRPDLIAHLRKFGYRTSGIGKTTIEDGITFLKSFKKIIIKPELKDLIEEFKKYSYKIESRSGLITHKIEDKWNHGIDAIRYSLIPLMPSRNVAKVNRVLGL